MQRPSHRNSRANAQPDHVALSALCVGLLSALAVILCTAAGAAEPAVEGPANSSNSAEFPRELVNFVPDEGNPVFTAEGAGHWDVKIRERGWILREGNQYRLWFTGYDGTRAGRKLLGHAISSDGIHWQRSPENPVYREHWVEDVMVVRDGDTYYMFAEGEADQAQWLTSPDGLHWTRQGRLDVRYKNGQPLTPGPYGTPTVWHEGPTWYLFYERHDRGVWLATSSDLKVWTHVQDEPVLSPGPAEYDRAAIAANQIVRYAGRYYAYYHAAATLDRPQWTTNVAVSEDLVHWKKYPGNPIVANNKSSGILVDDGQRLRLYTMHDQVDLFFPR